MELAYRYEHDRYRWFDRSIDSIIGGTWGSIYTQDSINEGALTVSYGIIDRWISLSGRPTSIAAPAKAGFLQSAPAAGRDPGSSLQVAVYRQRHRRPGGRIQMDVLRAEGLSLAVKPGANLPWATRTQASAPVDSDLPLFYPEL